MKEKNIKYVVIGIIVLLVIGFFSIIFLSKKSNPGTETQNENQQAVNQGQSARPQSVKPMDASDHVLGSLTAPVKIIVYSDFECPFCLRFEDTLKQIEQTFAGKVAIAFRQFPLSFHPEAFPAALASECASEQGKFWEMHDKLFADNKNGNMSADQFKKDAADLGLNTVQFDKCLDTEKYKDKVQAQVIEGKNEGVTGTPTSFVNGQMVVGAYPFEDFTASDGTQTQGMKSIIEKYLNQ